LVPGPEARVVDVDVKETIGSGPGEHVNIDGVVAACRDRPTGLGANQLEIYCVRGGAFSGASFW
jgi:hypothetical protein